MPDWKEERIGEYCTLSTDIAKLEQSIREDIEIHTLLEKHDEILKRITKIAETRNLDIEEAKRRQAVIKGHLLEHWDTEDKTFKCDVGTATVRTTKSLIVTDNFGLIDRLTEILGSGVRACECIRTFELSTIRKYMDADLFAEHIAHYDEKRNVIIRDMKNGKDSENEG